MKKIIKGYGHYGLLKKAKTIGWRPDGEDSKTFRGLGIEDYCLTDPADELCPQRYRVILKEAESSLIEIEGFASILPKNLEAGSIKLAGQKLSSKPTPGSRLYYIIIISE